MNQRFANYMASLQRKPTVVSGHVASVAIDPDTGQQTHAQIAVGTNLLRIRLDQFAPPLANGDAVRLAQYGLAASAEYRLAGIEAGGRSNTGLFPVMNDGTVLGGVAYPGGDFIFGKLDEGNLHIEAQTGRLYQRVGFDVYGILYPDGRHLLGHCAKTGGEWTPDGANLLLSADALRLRAGETDTIRLTADGVAWVERKMHVSRNGVLQVGDDFGAQIRMGRVVELDADGNVIVEDFDRYAVRVIDATGLPRIGILTGTPDAPFSPALMLGLETDAHFLRYQSGLLRVVGRGEFVEGEIAGFTLVGTRLVSKNGRFRILSEEYEDYGEGLALTADTPDKTGVLRWTLPDAPNWNIGLEYFGRDPNFLNTYLHYSHVSTPQNQPGYTKHVWVSGGWGSQNRTLTWDSEGMLGNVRSLVANNIMAFDTQDDFNPNAIRLVGRIWDDEVLPPAFPTKTNMGDVVVVSDYSNFPEGVSARLITNGAEVPVPLNVRNPFDRNESRLFIAGLRIHWKKTTQAAYLQSIELVRQSFAPDGKTSLRLLSNEQYNVAAGSFTTVVVAEGETPIEISNTFGERYYLIIKGAGMANAGELRIMGVEYTLCDYHYKDLNYG